MQHYVMLQFPSHFRGTWTDSCFITSHVGFKPSHTCTQLAGSSASHLITVKPGTINWLLVSNFRPRSLRLRSDLNTAAARWAETYECVSVWVCWGGLGGVVLPGHAVFPCSHGPSLSRSQTLRPLHSVPCTPPCLLYTDCMSSDIINKMSSLKTTV